MSRQIAALVYSKRLGSGARKAVLAYCAEKASNDGTGVWASKATIADAIEMGRSTVIQAINEFLAEGLLRQTGKHACANGATTVYALNLAAIRALPDIKPKAGAQEEADPKAGTSPANGLVQPLDPTRPATGPKPSMNRPLRGDEEMAGPSADEIQAAFDAFNAFAAENGWWKRALKLNKTRSSALRNRLKDADGVEGWKAALVRAEASDFLMGRTKEGFQPGIDFFCQESSFLKLVEGNYDNRSGVRGSRGNVAVFPAAGRGGAPTSLASLVAQSRLGRSER